MENQKFSLRSTIAKYKEDYTLPDGSVKQLWADEGCAWAIQDYYGSRGSLLDFTEDDWAAAAEEGWSKEEVATLCLGDDYLDRHLEALQFYVLEAGNNLTESYYTLFRELRSAKSFSVEGYEELFQFKNAVRLMYDIRFKQMRPVYITFGKEENGCCYYLGLQFLGEADSSLYMRESAEEDSDPGYRRVMVKKYGYIILPGPDDAALEAVKNISDGEVDWGDIETDDAEIIENCCKDGSII